MLASNRYNFSSCKSWSINVMPETKRENRPENFKVLVPPVGTFQTENEMKSNHIFPLYYRKWILFVPLINTTCRSKSTQIQQECCYGLCMMVDFTTRSSKTNMRVKEFNVLYFKILNSYCCRDLYYWMPINNENRLTSYSTMLSLNEFSHHSRTLLW